MAINKLTDGEGLERLLGGIGTILRELVKPYGLNVGRVKHHWDYCTYAATWIAEASDGEGLVVNIMPDDRRGVFALVTWQELDPKIALMYRREAISRADDIVPLVEQTLDGAVMRGWLSSPSSSEPEAL